MTQANDPISQTVYRQTGDDSYRPATEKEIQQGIYLLHKEGLTKREYFAANFQFNPENMSYKENVAIMGCEAPSDKLENIKWWISAQAKYRVMFADLLINALNKQS